MVSWLHKTVYTTEFTLTLKISYGWLGPTEQVGTRTAHTTQLQKELCVCYGGHQTIA